MTIVNVAPMSEDWRRYAERWLPRPRFIPAPPPIFSGGEPTEADRALAIELWRALDWLSKRWYVGWKQDAVDFVGLPLTDADIESMRQDIGP